MKKAEMLKVLKLWVTKWEVHLEIDDRYSRVYRIVYCTRPFHFLKLHMNFFFFFCYISFSTAWGHSWFKFASELFLV